MLDEQKARNYSYYLKISIISITYIILCLYKKLWIILFNECKMNKIIKIVQINKIINKFNDLRCVFIGINII